MTGGVADDRGGGVTVGPGEAQRRVVAVGHRRGMQRRQRVAVGGEVGADIQRRKAGAVLPARLAQKLVPQWLKRQHMNARMAGDRCSRTEQRWPAVARTQCKTLALRSTRRGEFHPCGCGTRSGEHALCARNNAYFDVGRGAIVVQEPAQGRFIPLVEHAHQGQVFRQGTRRRQGSLADPLKIPARRTHRQFAARQGLMARKARDDQRGNERHYGQRGENNDQASRAQPGGERILLRRSCDSVHGFAKTGVRRSS